MTDQTELHNRLAGEIVASIVKPVMASGGDFTDVLVLTESVVLGVVLCLAKHGSGEVVFDKFTEGVRHRLADLRKAQN